MSRGRGIAAIAAIRRARFMGKVLCKSTCGECVRPDGRCQSLPAQITDSCLVYLVDVDRVAEHVSDLIVDDEVRITVVFCLIAIQDRVFCTIAFCDEREPRRGIDDERRADCYLLSRRPLFRSRPRASRLRAFAGQTIWSPSLHTDYRSSYRPVVFHPARRVRGSPPTRGVRRNPNKWRMWSFHVIR